MSNKETLQSFNNRLNKNNLNLDNVLETINSLPKAINTDYTPEFISFRGYTGNSLEIATRNIDTSNITNMKDIFNGCKSLTSLDLSGWNTSKVTSMQNMFNSCSSLTNLDLSSFDTSKVTSMQNMFNSCSSLTNLDLSSFDTSNVTNMQNIFDGCYSLTKLDIRNFNFDKVTTYLYMFMNIQKDCEIIVKDDTAKEWVLSMAKNYSSVEFTNIKTVTELEG